MSSSKKVYQILLILGLLLPLLPGNTWAQVDSIPVSTQIAYLLPSNILSEERAIWIHTPSDYQSSKEAYPVIYLLDGEGHFKYVSQMVDYLSGYDRNRIPKIIVVGIVNVDRGRDFIPVLDSAGSPRRNVVSSSAGAGRFLQFIQKELVPYMDKNYRTQPYRILAGHSAGGLFAFYAKQTAPHLFHSIILMSPAINFGPAQVRSNFTAFLRSQKDLAGKMFITLGNENTQYVDSLVQQLKAYAPPKLTWNFRYYEDENHFSVTYKSFFDALKFIYANWFYDFYSDTKISSQSLEVKFKKLSEEFGYNISPSEQLVNNCGYQQLRLGYLDNALDLFKKNVKLYPDSFNVYDSLGEAYMMKGDKKLAIQCYEKSLSLNSNNQNGKEMLKKLRNQ